MPSGRNRSVPEHHRRRPVDRTAEAVWCSRTVSRFLYGRSTGRGRVLRRSGRAGAAAARRAAGRWLLPVFVDHASGALDERSALFASPPGSSRMVHVPGMRLTVHPAGSTARDCCLHEPPGTSSAQMRRSRLLLRATRAPEQQPGQPSPSATTQKCRPVARQASPEGCEGEILGPAVGKVWTTPRCVWFSSRWRSSAG